MSFNGFKYAVCYSIPRDLINKKYNLLMDKEDREFTELEDEVDLFPEG